ncbi:MAG: VCBS repeat-containing protein, partial [Planctomycetes bacterium]|nr:VCBS repeat-containing protein [Planctomycetota bacterium]
MNLTPIRHRRAAVHTRLLALLIIGPVLLAAGAAAYRFGGSYSKSPASKADSDKPSNSGFRPRFELDAVGFVSVNKAVERWDPNASLAEIAAVWDRIGYRTIERIDRQLASKPQVTPMERYSALYTKASLLNYEGDANQAYQLLSQAREFVESDDALKKEMLYNLVFLQGITALRRGETENCILCRGESSCILPISAAARHVKPAGSRTAIQHFTEYLEQFPDDFEIRWLLNLAHMTLGEHPEGVDPRYLISLDHYRNSPAEIGRFRDLGQQVGVNRLNQSGGAIMDDFNNDGCLDIVVTSFDPCCPMAFFQNTGTGVFEDRTDAAGLSGQLGGLNCLQADYNNDGRLDLFIVRGAWASYPMRPSLLRNEGNSRFTDVTEESGLFDPV